MSLASPKRVFGDSSQWASQTVLDLRFPWLGVCKGCGVPLKGR